MNKWAKFKKIQKRYNVNPLEYLQKVYGQVYHDDLENILSMDDLVEDSNRMQEDLSKQKKEFESKQKRQGKDFSRI